MFCLLSCSSVACWQDESEVIGLLVVDLLVVGLLVVCSWQEVFVLVLLLSCCLLFCLRVVSLLLLVALLVGR